MSQQITELATREKAKSVTERFAALERPRTAWGRFTQAFSSSSVTVLVVVIAVMWSIPTFGLFVASFRPPQLIASTGWWSGLVPPWHFTIENYQAVILQQGFGQAFLNSLIIAIPGTLLPNIGPSGLYTPPLGCLSRSSCCATFSPRSPRI